MFNNNINNFHQAGKYKIRLIEKKLLKKQVFISSFFVYKEMKF